MSNASHTLSFRKAACWAIVAGAAVAVTGAPSAAANSAILPTPGDGPASIAVQQLQSAGYDVSINWLEGHPNVPLSECKVSGISGLKVIVMQDDVVMMMTEPGGLNTVYVDITCPNAK